MNEELNNLQADSMNSGLTQCNGACPLLTPYTDGPGNFVTRNPFNLYSILEFLKYVVPLVITLSILIYLIYRFSKWIYIKLSDWNYPKYIFLAVAGLLLFVIIMVAILYLSSIFQFVFYNCLCD